jgi:putative phosphoribosyl transferase
MKGNTGVMRFRDRFDAGRQLADRVVELDLADPVVLGMPRGGVPVAAPVAAALNAPLDIFVVRKVGAPGRPELGVGAVAEGGDEAVVNAVARQLRLSGDDVRRLAVAAGDELARQVLAYRGGRPMVAVDRRDVVLVDDGLATGVSAEAGLRALRQLQPCTLHFAAPVCARQSLARVEPIADGVVSVLVADDLGSVGEWYDDFTQTTDNEVIRLLADEFGWRRTSQEP